MDKPDAQTLYPVFQPEADPNAKDPEIRRWNEQRWLVDNAVRANGIARHHPRLDTIVQSLGPEAAPDAARINGAVQKHDDIAPALEAGAQRREDKARAAEAEGSRYVARDSYFMASNFWAAGQWAICARNETNLRFNHHKRDCYLRFAALANHHVEPIWIPFQGKALPGWLHLPIGYAGGKLPLVVSLPGMDGFKERFVHLHGDRWLDRGFAVLLFEGPGQFESAALGIHFSVEAWQQTGKALMDWAESRAEIDASRVGLVGSSFGTFFGTIAAAYEPRFKACAIHGTCLEPTGETIFNHAHPFFKLRFMYMSGYTDEAKFDEFRKSITWEGHADKISMPYLCIAGEMDELSPLAHTDRLFNSITGPRQLVVYQGGRHGVGGSPSAALGPYFPTLVADWMAARLDDQPFKSERWYVDSRGGVTKTAY